MRSGMTGLVAGLAAGFIALPGVAAAGFFSAPPLGQLAELVPLDASGDITLLDIAASRRETAKIGYDDAPDVADLQPYAHLFIPEAFDRNGLLLYDLPAAMGFGYGDMDGMAGWGTVPAAMIAVTGNAQLAGAITAGTALAARGYELGDVGGVPVWWRQEDGMVDFAHRSEDPFAGAIGQSIRLALDDGVLISARTWAEMRSYLGGSQRLDGDADVAALLSAIEDSGIAGSPTQMMLLGRLGPRLEALPLNGVPEGGYPGLELPAMPRALRVALIEWQDGARFTGAIGMVYPTATTAEVAAARFEVLLGGMSSLVRRAPFAEILPKDRDVRSGAHGVRHVVLFIFRGDEADLSRGVGLLALLGASPMRRFVDMYYQLDLQWLIGWDE